MSENNPGAFEKANAEKQTSLVIELILFMRHNKKYWLIPLLIVLLLASALVILGGTAVAPFVYSLF